MAQDILASMAVAIGCEISGFDRGVATVKKELAGLVKAGERMQSVGQSLSLYVTTPLILAGTASLKVAGDMQALEKGFAATYKGAEPLSVALARINELAKLPGLGLKEALQGATNLQAAGFSADLAARSLSAFGNALATVGKGKADLDGVGLALGQIASKGKISAEEINQLAERVPQIRQAMKAAFGTADTEALQKAKISATDFVEGVTRELEKLPKVTGGLNNAFENLADAGTTAMAKLGGSLNNAFNIEGNLGKLADLVTAAGVSFSNLSPEAQRVGFVLAGIAAAAGPVLFVVGSLGVALPVLTVGFTALGTAAAATWAAVTGPIGLVVAGLALVGAAVLDAKEKFGTFQQAAEGLGSYLAQMAVGPLQTLRDTLSTLGFPVLSAAVGVATEKVQGLSLRLAQLSDAGPVLVLSRAFTEFGAVVPQLSANLKALNEDARLNQFFKSAEGVDYFADLFVKATGAIKKSTIATAEQTAALEKQLLALQKLNEGYDQMGLRRPKSLDQTTPDFELKVPKMALPDKLYKLPPIDTTAVASSLTEFQILLAGFKDELGLTTDEISAALTNAFSGIALSIGTSLANGSSVIAAAGAALLKALGDLAIKKGTLLVADGVANLFIPGLQGLGVATIAAGTALIAAGGAAGVIGSSLGGSGSGGRPTGGGSYSPARTSAPAKTPEQRIVIELAPVVFRQKGPDLEGITSISKYRQLRLS